jgi:hypothetical protein
VSAWTGPLRGHGRPRVRWPRRIAGVLGTAALFAVAIVVATMILDQTGGGSGQSALSPPATSAGKGTTHHAKASQPATSGQPAQLTAAQRKARTAAVAAVRAQGYEPVDVNQFDPSHALRVLVAHGAGDSSGPRRAFFFRGSHLVGTDSDAPSTGLKVAGAGSSWATLSYGVYASGDQACCPSGGRVKVRFGWTGGTVAPVGGTMPPSTQRVAAG